MRSIVRSVPILLGVLLAVAAAPPASSAPAVDQANCAAFTVVGDPRTTAGATWTYRSTDAGVTYALEGVLFAPTGAGPFPAAVVSHGKGGTPGGYSANMARIMVGWGMVVIGTMYTHAPDAADQGNLPDGPDGASTANVQRARKARELLACVGGVALNRVAAHGNSMGAFLTGQLLGVHPGLFRAASHTAGGVGTGAATKVAAAELIVTPYQLHHGDADQTVPLIMDQRLAAILAGNGTTHQLHVYPGVDHGGIAFDPTMLSRTRTWYRTHGVLA